MREFRESDELDCRVCGACCTAERAEAVYVPVTALDRRRLPNKYDKKLVELPAEEGYEEPFTLPLKRFGDKWACVALKGTLGKVIQCDVYAQRPEFCRTYEKGSEECLQRRAEVFVIIPAFKE